MPTARFIGQPLRYYRREGSDYMKYGTLYYPSGALRFVGTYDETISFGEKSCLPIAGTKFREDGTRHMEGLFQRCGLYCGRIYYPSGKVKFVGIFNDKSGAITGRQPEDYYGPSYPVEGIFFAEGGQVLYNGKFKVVKFGGLNYPKVIVPEDYGSLN